MHINEGVLTIMVDEFKKCHIKLPSFAYSLFGSEDPLLNRFIEKYDQLYESLSVSATTASKLQQQYSDLMLYISNQFHIYDMPILLTFPEFVHFVPLGFPSTRHLMLRNYALGNFADGLNFISDYMVFPCINNLQRMLHWLEEITILNGTNVCHITEIYQEVVRRTFCDVRDEQYAEQLLLCGILIYFFGYWGINFISDDIVLPFEKKIISTIGDIGTEQFSINFVRQLNFGFLSLSKNATEMISTYFAFIILYASLKTDDATNEITTIFKYFNLQKFVKTIPRNVNVNKNLYYLAGSVLKYIQPNNTDLPIFANENIVGFLNCCVIDNPEYYIIDCELLSICNKFQILDVLLNTCNISHIVLSILLRLKTRSRMTAIHKLYFISQHTNHVLGKVLQCLIPSPTNQNTISISKIDGEICVDMGRTGFVCSQKELCALEKISKL